MAKRALPGQLIGTFRDQRGDVWQLRETYVGDQAQYVVVDDEGLQVASVAIDPKAMVVDHVSVAPAHQYRGLANAAYDVIEGHHGQPLVGSRDPSPQGQALWRARAKSTARIFDAGREHAAGLAGQQAGRLITHVTEEVRTTLRTIIASGVAANDSPQTIARRLKAWVSLTPAQVKSTVAYAGELVDMGHSFPRVQALVQRYVTKKKLIRAEAIAAYESMHAVNRGVISAAKQAQADGRLGWRATKEWRSRQDPIVCKRCKALHGVRIPLDSVFPDGAGAGPPRHGYCRCWLVIHEEA